MVAALGLGATACGGGDDGDGGAGSDVIIPETTKVLDSATLDALDEVSADRAVYTFTHSTPLLDNLQAGDVIVSDVHPPLLPFGTLRKVESVQRGASVVVSTGQAALTDAVDRGSIHEQVRFSKTGSHPLSVGPDGLVIAFNDVVIFDGDDDSSTKYDQILLDGNLGFEPSIDFDVDIDGFELASMKFGVSTDLSASVTVTASREAEFSDKRQVGQVTLPTITFAIGPVPVVIVPKLIFWAGVDGKIAAVMQAGAELDAHAGAGFGYDGDQWAPYADITGSGSLQTPKLKDGVKASARVWAGPRLDVLLYDMAGVNAFLKGYARAELDSEANPWWKLSAGLEANLGAGLWIFGATIAEYSTPALGKEFPIGDAGGPSPSAETPGIDTWARTYGGDNIDYPLSVLTTSDGGTLMVGSSNSFTSSPSDGWIVKLDALGGISWQLAVDDQGDATNAVETDTGYVVSMGTSGVATGDLVLLWLDKNGSVVSARSYDTPGGLAPDAMVAAADGDLVLAGSRDGEADGWAARIGLDGAVRWSRTFGGTSSDALHAIAPLPGSGFAVAGVTDSHGANFGATWVLALTGDGQITWQKLYDGDSNEWLRAMVSDAAGNLTLLADNYGDAIIARLTPAGALSWARHYDAGTAFEQAAGLVAAPDGSFVAVGKTDLYTPWLWAFKVGATGDVIWSRSYGGGVGEQGGGGPESVGRPIALSSQNGFLLAGQSESFGDGYENVWLLHVQENGFIELDATTGAKSQALTGSTGAYTLGAKDIAVTVTELPLTVTDVTQSIVFLSTDAIVKTQAEVP